MPDVNERFYQQVSESIKLVFDLTSRIDERVKILIEQHNEANHRIEKLMERHEGIMTRISVLENRNNNNFKDEIAEIRKEQKVLEIKLTALEMTSSHHDNKWKVVGDAVFKIGIAIVGGFIAWKLGIN